MTWPEAVVIVVLIVVVGALVLALIAPGKFK
jgi:hypothetical protein